MRTLSELWARRDHFSAKASDTVRNSAIAGLAAVWLFSDSTDGGLDTLSSAPWGLLLAGALFAASLACDILHYFVAGEVFFNLARRKEAELGQFDPDATVAVTTADVMWPNVLYRAKASFLFVGYALVVGVLVRAAF